MLRDVVERSLPPELRGGRSHSWPVDMGTSVSAVGRAQGEVGPPVTHEGLWGHLELGTGWASPDGAGCTVG